MDDGTDRSVDRWLRLGRLLPGEIRERVFELALTDLLIKRAEDHKVWRMPFPLAAVATLVSCAPGAIGWAFVRKGVVTRFGRLALLSASFAVGLAVLVQRLTRVETGY